MNNFVPLSSLRLQRQLAPASTYIEPHPGMLAKSIVEGKRRLDELTRNDLSGVSDASRLAPPASSTHDGQYLISPDDPIPLPGTLSHRLLQDLHLWIGVEEGIAIVLDEDEHRLFLRLRDGMPPSEVVAEEFPTVPAEEGWHHVNNLIARLAIGGFIRGVEGYTDHWEPTPRRFMRLHLTQRCNLTCVHCYADSSPYVSSDGEMPLERWLKIIDDFADAGGERVLFTGGEALVYKGCDQLLRRAKERNLDVTLFSNGILIDRFLDVIRECVDQVQISIDGPDPETNDPIRGAGSFQRAKKAVDTLLNAGVKVRISMVVMEQNLEAMRHGFVDFAKQWDGKGLEWRLGYGVAHHGRGSEIGDTLEIHDVRPIVDDLLEQVEGSGGPRIARSTKSCGYAEQVVIAPDGGVHPCHLLDGAITHIDDQPMTDLMGLLKETSRNYSVDHSVGCNACDIRNLCGGSCRVQNGKATGNRRVTNCTAFDKLHRLNNLVQTFAEYPVAAVPESDWE